MSKCRRTPSLRRLAMMSLWMSQNSGAARWMRATTRRYDRAALPPQLLLNEAPHSRFYVYFF